MSLWKKTSPTDVVVWFLDLGLLAFLIFDFGFDNFQDLRQHKLILLPSLLISLIAFNFFEYYKFRNDKDINRSSRINLYILLALLLLEIIVIAVNYKSSLAQTFFNYR